jgi:lauroyl/myristoyl acyltransferase
VTGRSRPRPLKRLRWLGRDLAKLAWYLAGGTVALLVPSALDARVTAIMGRVSMWRSRRWMPRQAARMEAALGDRRPGTDWTEVTRENRRIVSEDWWARARWMAPRRWRPRIDVEGLEHLRAAMEAGSGVILWRASLASTLVVKVALWREGVEIVHLSRMNHGQTSPGWLARRVLRHLYVRSELAFIAERVVMPGNESLDHLRVLVDRLRSGAVVSIVGDNSSATPFVWPLLGKPWGFATGAPSLSRLTGCALLPVFTARVGPQHYRVVIGAPIEPDRSRPRRTFNASAVGAFAGRLEAWLTEHPAEWYQWLRHGGLPDPAPEPG